MDHSSTSSSSSLMNWYRGDRRKLMEFLLSSDLVTELRSPSGLAASLSDLDLDSLSADYVLDCIKSGGVVDVEEAEVKSRNESAYPAMIYSERGNSFFTISNPELTGSPPRRAPPLVTVNQDANLSPASTERNCVYAEKSSMSRGDIADDSKCNTLSGAARRPSANQHLPLLELPRLNTGLSDDDLRETAYELLLTSVTVLSNGEISIDDRKKVKNSRFLTRLKSRREKVRSQVQYSEGGKEFIDTVRVQMQISEIMDACIRRNLVQLAAGKMAGQVDIPQISLALLNGVFKSDFVNEKSYRQWKTRQANMLEEFLCFSVDGARMEYQNIKNSVAKIRDAKEWDTFMSPSERISVLASIKQVAFKYSSLSGKYGINGETYYWTAAYHLNFRLYQKLLFGVFDILDEGQLIEEADEFISIIKLTWSTLGVTQKLHHALYGWVLFQQFIATDEGSLLEYAATELQKLLFIDEVDGKERQYVNDLLCPISWNGIAVKLSLLQNISLSIGSFCDNKMHDYHLHFHQLGYESNEQNCYESLKRTYPGLMPKLGTKPSNFQTMMTLILVVGVPSSGNNGETKLIRLKNPDNNAAEIIKSYVRSSTKAAYLRIQSKMDLDSKVEKKHPLVVLANELKLIAEREFKSYYPVLRDSCPESLLISVGLLHEMYGERLRPFLNGLSSLTEEAALVLSAAVMLDSYLSELHASTCEADNLLSAFNHSLIHYEIVEISKPLILDWVIAQHAHIYEWTGRAFEIEEWEPLSNHQRHAASIVEVFRIIEETVDQLFGLNLPMDITHLQALLSIVFHSLDTYLSKIITHLVEKKHLYPSAAPLTRYTETVMPTIRRKVMEPVLLEESMVCKLNELSIKKICVRLNTLHYIQSQVGLLEDGIRKSWVVGQSHHRLTKTEFQEEVMEALFATTIGVIKDTAKDAIKKLSDFAGTRVMFWDLRERFLFQLYRGEVVTSRLDNFLPHIDTALDQLCRSIDDNLRDLLVLSVCRASLEAFVWVLLDGGPSRAFSDADVSIIQDDLTTLKEFFIADGEGLPRSLVEQEAKYAVHVLGLYSFQTEILIRMLMHASQNISSRLDPQRHDRTPMEDAHTLIRVLCHKKDREASRFLKRQYELPMSSDYDDAASPATAPRSPFISDLLSRSNSFHWDNKGQRTLTSLKEKLQRATSDIRHLSR